MESFESLNATQAEFDRQLVTVMHALPDGIAVLDETGVIVFVNQRLQELSQYGERELIGRRVEYLVPDDYPRIHEQAGVRSVEQRASRPIGECLDVRLRCKHGSIVPVDVHLSVTEIGANSYVLALVRAITPRSPRATTCRTAAKNASAPSSKPHRS